jgi:hypothetical protein
MPKHDKKLKCSCLPCEPVPPWSDTTWEPDAQWCPVISIQKPLKVVQVPFYTSTEQPTPEWAPNVIISAPVTYHRSHHSHHHNHHPTHNTYGGCSFLRSHWKDDIPMYVYGTNPFSDTVNSGGSHFQ